jgi:hypothetical protein
MVAALSVMLSKTKNAPGYGTAMQALQRFTSDADDSHDNKMNCRSSTPSYPDKPRNESNHESTGKGPV